MELTKDRVMSALTSIIEPSMGINVVDLGSVYEVLIENDVISVDLALPMADEARAGDVASEVEQHLRALFEDASVEVSLIWDPPWSPDLMTADARARFETTAV